MAMTARESTVRAMARTWDRLAATDPMHFVATSRRRWSATEFFDSGRPDVERVLDWVGPGVPRRRMLEIGCGLGRTAVHFARVFERVDGIDISPAMIHAARQHALPENVRLTVGSGRDLAPYEDDAFDLVFSTLVFQHIPSVTVIAGYLAEIARVLRPDGAAVLQFDTRRRGLASLAYAALPDVLLPAVRRRHVRRYRRDPAALRRLFAAAGLEVVDEIGRGTASHYHRLARTPEPVAP